MTYEQALEIKQNLTPEQVRNDLERYLLRGEPPIVKGVAMAMQALEKQIPKKPKYIEGDYDMPLCPNCGMSVDENEELHCSTCGQALDWGDSE